MNSAVPASPGTPRHAARLAAIAGIAVAAITAELSLFLDWRTSMITSMFGSVDSPQRLPHALAAASAWSAQPVFSILLTVLIVCALGAAAVALRRRPAPLSARVLLGSGAAAAVVYCVTKLLSSSPEGEYVLHGYGATLYSGVFSGRPDHGAGVTVCLAATAVLLTGVAVLTMTLRGSDPTHPADS